METSSRLRRIISGLVREPVCQFFLVGVLLWAYVHHAQQNPPDQRIVVSKAQVSRIADGYRLQFGVAPSDQQLKVLVSDFVEDEVAYREARGLGLDIDDEIIRRRLIQKFRFLQQSISVPESPTREALKRFYDQHVDRYRDPDSVTFLHVYFSSDLRSDQEARDAAGALSKRLNDVNVSDCHACGDRFEDGAMFSEVSKAQLEQVFGHSEFTEQIFSAPVKRWSRPIRSRFGWHVAYVIARRTSEQRSFESTEKDVLRDYLEEEQMKLDEEVRAKLRARFTVVRE